MVYNKQTIFDFKITFLTTKYILGLQYLFKKDDFSLFTFLYVQN